jgi:hypothetical protein
VYGYTSKFSLLAQILRGLWLSKTGICSRQDAKNAKSGSLNFFATFAPLREIFRVSVAALPR